MSEEFHGVDFSEFNVENGEEFTQNLLFIAGFTSLLLHGGNIAGFRPEDKTIITKGTIIIYAAVPTVPYNSFPPSWNCFDSYQSLTAIIIY